ncbi:MAG: RNA polymerase sigma factor [Pseudomonadota bacterium]
MGKQVAAGSNRQSAAERDDDRQLMALVVHKDRTAFEQLYKRYYHRVFQFAYRMVKDHGVVEEIVDDTMFAVWKSAASFQGKSAVSTWIFGIAYRRALKTLEKGRKHQAMSGDNEQIYAEPDMHPTADPAAAAQARDLHRQLQQGIDHLSSDHKAVMMLTGMGYSYGEISEIVDCPENTVKTRMFHALKYLKNHLSDSALGALSNPEQKNLWTQNTPIS